MTISTLSPIYIILHLTAFCNGTRNGVRHEFLPDNKQGEQRAKQDTTVLTLVLSILEIASYIFIFIESSNFNNLIQIFKQSK